MAMARRWGIVLVLVALAALAVLATAVRLESWGERESQQSLSNGDHNPGMRKEREWWEEEGEEEEERRRRRREEEEEEKEWEREERRREEEQEQEERERQRRQEEKERERREEEERAEEREREEEEERQREEEEERQREEEERRKEEEKARKKEEEKERKEEEKERRRKEREKEEEEEEKQKEEEEEEQKGKHSMPSPFVLQKPKAYLKTSAGSMKVLPRSQDERLASLQQLGLGFLTLEPSGLLLPHYLDAPVVIYMVQGNGRLGWVWNSEYKSVDLKDGDIYTLPGGTVHFILNTDSKLRLRIFSAMDARNSIIPGHFQPFFVAGGRRPQTVLSGFSLDILSAAFKRDKDRIADFLNTQNRGGIIYATGGDVNKSSSSVAGARPMLSNKVVGGSLWSAMHMHMYLLGASGASKPFNLLKKKADFKNDNGWSSTVDRKAFSDLKQTDLGMFAVNLKAGSMLAPHWNPSATEIAYVTKGRGYVHVAFPNGTKALESEVTEGTVFVVPRYYPVTQVASRDGTFQFVGFSTSSKPNNPQFLAGANSVLNLLAKDEEDLLAASFDSTKDGLHDFVDPQKEAVILPGLVVDPKKQGQSGRAQY